MYHVSIPCSPPLVPVLREREIIQSTLYQAYCNETNFNIFVLTMPLICNWPSYPVHALSTTRATCYAHLITLDLIFLIIIHCQSRWSCCLRRKSAAARLWVLRVRIPMRTWISMSCDCCVLCTQRPLRQADHKFRGVPPDLCVPLCVMYKPQSK